MYIMFVGLSSQQHTYKTCVVLTHSCKLPANSGIHAGNLATNRISYIYIYLGVNKYRELYYVHKHFVHVRENRRGGR